MDAIYKILHMYVIAQLSPNPLSYVHKNLFRGGGKATFAFPSENFPLPLSGNSILLPLRYLIQLYRVHQISVGFREFPGMNMVPQYKYYIIIL